MDFPAIGDPYFTTEGFNRRAYNGANGIPLIYVDGTPRGNPINYTAAARDLHYNVPTDMKIDATYRVECKTVHVKVKIHAQSNYGSTNYLRVAIFEKKTVNNKMSNLETEFFNVMKKFIPDEVGTSIPSMSAGDSLSYNFTYTFQGDYRKPYSAGDQINHAIEHSVEQFFDLGVAVWVQNDIAGRMVHQATYAVDEVSRDAAMTRLIFPSKNIYLGQAPYTIKTRFQNWQDPIIQSADFYCQVDNGPVQNISRTNLGLGWGEYTDIEFPVTWSPGSSGTYTVKAWAANLNTGIDQVSCNDTLIQQVVVQPGIFPTATFYWVGNGGSLAWFTNLTPEDPSQPNVYKWDFGDNGGTSTQANPIWSFSSIGVFDVCLKAYNHVGEDSICQLVSVPVSGLSEELESSIEISPNPSDGIFKIHNSNSQEVDFEVLSLDGKTLITGEFGRGSNILNLQETDPGGYLLIIQMGEKKATKRLVIK